MRNSVSDRDPRDAAWLNLVVVAYAVCFSAIMAIEMLQPVAWYLRGGPLIGARQVHPILSSMSAAIGSAGWVVLLLPLVVAIVVLTFRSAFCRPALVALGVFAAMLPLLRLSPAQVFAPFATLRIDHEDGVGRIVWMLSDGGTSLTAYDGPDGPKLYLGNISRDMIVPVAHSVSGSQNGRWQCVGTEESGTFTLTAGRSAATLEGCALDVVPEERIEGLSEMEAFSVLTLLSLIRPGT